MPTLHRRRRPDARTLIWLGVLVGTLAIGAVLVTAYQLELGLSKPSSSAQRMIDRVVAIEAVTGSDDYWAYAAALQEARADLDDYRTIADADVRQHVARSLALHEAAREAWYLEYDGEWSAETHGTPDYWRGAYASLEWPWPDGATLSAEDVKRESWALAQEALAEAQEIVDRAGGGS